METKMLWDEKGRMTPGQTGAEFGELAFANLGWEEEPRHRLNGCGGGDGNSTYRDDNGNGSSHAKFRWVPVQDRLNPFVPFDQMGSDEEVSAELKRRSEYRSSRPVEPISRPKPVTYNGQPELVWRSAEAGNDWRIGLKDRQANRVSREDRQWRFDRLVTAKVVELDDAEAEAELDEARLTELTRQRSWQEFCQQNPWAGKSASGPADFIKKIAGAELDARVRCRQLFGHDDVAKVLAEAYVEAWQAKTGFTAVMAEIRNAQAA